MALVTSCTYFFISSDFTDAVLFAKTVTRNSIAEPVYAKKALLQKDSNAQKKLKLQRVGESVFEKGQWSINDEEVHMCCCYITRSEYVSGDAMLIFSIQSDFVNMNPNEIYIF